MDKTRRTTGRCPECRNLVGLDERGNMRRHRDNTGTRYCPFEGVVLNPQGTNDPEDANDLIHTETCMDRIFNSFSSCICQASLVASLRAENRWLATTNTQYREALTSMRDRAESLLAALRPDPEGDEDAG